jgi:hypothetical protein
MKRFKDSKQINNLVIASGPTPPSGKFPKDPGFLKKTSPIFWNTRIKPIEKSPTTGAGLIRSDAPKYIQSALNAVQAKSGFDERLNIGVALTSAATTGFGALKSLGSYAGEFTYFLPAISLASIMVAAYMKAKPSLRAYLIGKIPHIEDTLNNIENKTYRIIEENSLGSVGLGQYTLPQIAKQISQGTLSDGVWTNANGVKRQFENASDVQNINLMLQHQKVSEIRDALMSFGALPVTLAGIGVASSLGQKKMQADFDSGYGKKPKDITLTAPRVESDQDTTTDKVLGQIRVDGRYRKFTKRVDNKFYVPDLNRWVIKD